MDLEALWAEIEADQFWRMEEIRFFQNRVSELTNQEEKEQFRRVLVLLVYAHFEGFCKFAFLHYIKAVNREGIRCGDASYAIAAASLYDLFQSLRYPEAKCPEFRNTLPDDKKLHLFAREREFVQRANNFEERFVIVPDDVVDTESNLEPIVLRKNLFKLGFRHDQFESIEGDIHTLLNFRHKIAHGELKSGIRDDQYNKVYEAAITIINQVKRDVMKGLEEKWYLRSIADQVNYLPLRKGV